MGGIELLSLINCALLNVVIHSIMLFYFPNRDTTVKNIYAIASGIRKVVIPKPGQEVAEFYHLIDGRDT